MFAIPITPETLDLLEALNDGVRPELENEETFFIFRGMDAPNSISTSEQVSRSIAELGKWKTIKILYL